MHIEIETEIERERIKNKKYVRDMKRNIKRKTFLLYQIKTRKWDSV